MKKELEANQKPKSLSASSAVDSQNTSASGTGANRSAAEDGPKISWSISKEATVGLEEKLRGSVVGQAFAVRSIIAAVHRWASGWVDPQRPLVWLFVGPSGVGKTELSKALATALFGEDRDAMIRVDMSEYQDKSMVNKVRKRSLESRKNLGLTVLHPVPRSRTRLRWFRRRRSFGKFIGE